MVWALGWVFCWVECGVGWNGARLGRRGAERGRVGEAWAALEVVRQLGGPAVGIWRHG